MVFFILLLVNSVIVTINNIQLAKNPKLLSNKSTTDEIILMTKNAVKHIKLAFPYMDIINFEYLLIINGLNHLIFFRRTFDVLSMLRS